MAKAAKGKAKEENGAAQGGQQGPQGQGQQPMLNVLAQFTKDFSFENPKAPDSLRPREKPPEIDIIQGLDAHRDTGHAGLSEIGEPPSLDGARVGFKRDLGIGG